MDNSFANQHPELVGEWSEKNSPLTPYDITYGSNKLYWWKGKCGHEWQASAKSRSHGEGCPICSGDRVIEGVNDFKSHCPELAEEWSRKNKLLPTMVTPHSSKKVIWHGKCGHEWTASVKSRVYGSGCPYCSHNIVLPGFNDLATIFPDVAAEWSEKNLPLLPSQVTPYANKKVWWECKEGHEWNALISTRSYGSKCPYCSGITLLKGFNDFATRKPELALEWSDRNYPLMPDMVNEKSTKNVWWKCSVCGYEWKSVVKARIKGTKCPVCADRTVLVGYNDLATTDPDILCEWDYEKNTDIQPTQISRSSMRYVWWKCKHGHSWRDKISNRTVLKMQCKVCEQEFDNTIPELLVMFYAWRLKLQVKIRDVETTGFVLDAYLPEIRIAFSFPYKGTQLEEDIGGVIQHLCEKRNIRYISISPKCKKEEICVKIKQAFQKAHLFINSDNQDDLMQIRKSFFEFSE